MRKVTDEMLEQYLEYITSPHVDYNPYGYLTIENSIKRKRDRMSNKDYENYKKSINFIDKNFSSIVSGLQSENISIKKQCAEVLGYFYDERSVEPLISSLKYPNNKFKLICTKSLVKIKKYSTEPLIKALKNPNKDIRRGAVKVLRKIPDKKYIDLYIKLLKDKDWFIRCNAIHLLISIVPSSDAIDFICKLITDNSVKVRIKVVWAIWYLYHLNHIHNIGKNLDIIEFIRCHELISNSVLIALNDKNETVRKKIIMELAKRVSFNVNSSLYKPLKNLLEEITKIYANSSTLEKNIIELVNYIGSDNLKSSIVSEKSKQRLINMWILRENLLKSVENKSNTLNTCFEVLNKYNEDSLIIYAKKALNDNPKIREYAIYLLGKLTRNDAFPILKEFLNDESPYVRKAVVQELSYTTDKNSIQLIKKALNDDSKLVREKAEIILYQRGELNNYRKAYLLEDVSPEERTSYNLWLSKLHKKNYMDFKDNKRYIYMFLYETVREFSENKNIKYLIANFDLIEQTYPNNIDLRKDLNNWRSGAYFILEEYEKSFFYKKRAGLDSYEDLFIFTALLNPSEKDLINGEIILKLFGEDNLTDFGKQYINEIIVAIDEILNKNYNKYNKHLISYFIHDHIFYSSKADENKSKHIIQDYISISLTDTNLNPLIKYFSNDNEFNELKFQYSRYQKGISHENYYSNEKDFYFKPFPRVLSKNYLDNYDLSMKVVIPTIIIKAFFNYVKKLIRKAENRVRKAHNLPEVGKWISETILVNKIKELFPDELIIQHGKPHWLGQQHLDIFFPKRNIGIEYQGQQHLGPVSYFGGENAFKELQKRDKRKKKIM